MSDSQMAILDCLRIDIHIVLPVRNRYNFQQTFGIELNSNNVDFKYQTTEMGLGKNRNGSNRDGTVRDIDGASNKLYVYNEDLKY